jgi:hypothetical protein
MHLSLEVDPTKTVSVSFELEQYPCRTLNMSCVQTLSQAVLRIHDILGWIRIQILDPDPAFFVIDLQDASKKLIFLHNFFCLFQFMLHLHHFSKLKSQKESQNSRNQGFSNYFCTMIEGSGSRAGSGSIPLTSGSGSGRPKNMWIRIRIRNTGLKWQHGYRLAKSQFLINM